MSAVAGMMALTGSLSGAEPTTERYFALFGAGGAGGSPDTTSADIGAAGGNGAFMEIKVEGIPLGMVFNMVCGDGGTGPSRATAGGRGGGGGSASILRCQYDGADVLLAVAGAGGGGGGGGDHASTSGREPTAGAGASSTSQQQNDAPDGNNTVRGGHTAGTSSSPSMASHGTDYARLNPPTRETYAQDGGAGARSDGYGISSSTPLGGGGGGGSLPTASWGGQGGNGGVGNSSEGGGGGGGGGYYGGCGGTGGTGNGNSGAGGGGGSSYVRSGSVSVGSATLTVTLIQEAKGLFRTGTAYSNVWQKSSNASVSLEYMTSSGLETVGRGGNGGRNEATNTAVLSNAEDGNAGRVQIHSDTALIQANTSGGTQVDHTVTAV